MDFCMKTDKNMIKQFHKDKEKFKNGKKRIIINCGAICDFDCKNCMVTKYNSQ